MSSSAARPEVVVLAAAVLGEGPVWDPRRDALVWTDIESHVVHVSDPGSGADEVVATPGPVGSLAPTDGGYVVAMGTALARTDYAFSSFDELSRVEAPPGYRFNDGAADPVGRYLVGTVGPRPDGVLHEFDQRPDAPARSRSLLSDVGVSNGIAWSVDGRTMYFSDSLAGGVDAFDYDVDTGRIARRRRIVDVAAGLPDGLTADGEGCLWLALWGASAVHRYAPDGRLLQEVELPVSLVTCPVFGGPGHATLFVTTATRDLTPVQRREQPLAGSVFAVDVGVAGLPANHVVLDGGAGT